MVIESLTVVVDSKDVYLNGVRNGFIVQGDSCEVVMVILLFVIRVAVDFSGATLSLLVLSHVCSVFR